MNNNHIAVKRFVKDVEKQLDDFQVETREEMDLLIREMVTMLTKHSECID